MRHVLRTILPCAVLLTILAAPASALTQRAVSYQRSNGTPALPFLWGMVPGLVTVDMRFTNAEHSVKELTCMPHDEDWTNLIVVLHDGNEDDPHDGVLQWGDLTPYPVRGRDTVERTGCAGSCRITIPPLAFDEAFVLAGFSFEYHDYFASGDSRVEEIMVRPRPYSGWIDVAFDDGAQRAFDVWVSYARIPLAAVASFDAMTAQVPVQASVTSTRTPGPAVLQGFYLGFADHNGRSLNRFAVDLSNNQLLRMTWRDLAGDDLMNWSASWLRLRY
jgi:hypothetical protein